MKPSHSSIDPPSRVAGIGLVELLVAVTLGMVASVAMFGLLESAEARRRTASGASEAEVAGVAGGFALERELKLAGYGFARSGVVGCKVVPLPPALPSATFPLLPVVITQGANAPDTIDIVAGSSSILNDPVKFSAGTATTKDLVNPAGFFVNEQVVLTSGLGASASCALVKIAAVANNRITHSSVASFPADGTAIGVGATLQRARWTVSGNRLVRTDLGAGTPAQEVSDVIVDLQAQYGYDANANGLVADTEWVDTLPVGADPLRVIAVRFATLSRSGQFERAVATTTAPRWAAANVAFTMKNLDGTADLGTPAADATADPNNWRYYRYRVHEFVVPLRNLIWGRTT